MLLASETTIERKIVDRIVPVNTVTYSYTRRKALGLSVAVFTGIVYKHKNEA